MKIMKLNKSMTELHKDNGEVILFSYNTPVAAFKRMSCIGGFYYQHIKTNKKYSRTTSRHISKWLNSVHTLEVPQQEIDELV